MCAGWGWDPNSVPGAGSQREAVGGHQEEAGYHTTEWTETEYHQNLAGSHHLQRVCTPHHGLLICFLSYLMPDIGYWFSAYYLPVLWYESVVFPVSDCPGNTLILDKKLSPNEPTVLTSYQCETEYHITGSEQHSDALSLFFPMKDTLNNWYVALTSVSITCLRIALSGIGEHLKHCLRQV